jgi:hypothetical protein
MQTEGIFQVRLWLRKVFLPIGGGGGGDDDVRCYKDEFVLLT